MCAENWAECCHQSGSCRGPEPCKQHRNKGLIRGLDPHKEGKPGCKVRKAVQRTNGGIDSSCEALGRAGKSVLEGSRNNYVQ